MQGATFSTTSSSTPPGRRSRELSFVRLVLGGDGFGEPFGVGGRESKKREDLEKGMGRGADRTFVIFVEGRE
jgi:hypothetical protein